MLPPNSLLGRNDRLLFTAAADRETLTTGLTLLRWVPSGFATTLRFVRNARGGEPVSLMLRPADAKDKLMSYRTDHQQLPMTDRLQFMDEDIVELARMYAQAEQAAMLRLSFHNVADKIMPFMPHAGLRLIYDTQPDEPGWGVAQLGTETRPKLGDLALYVDVVTIEAEAERHSSSEERHETFLARLETYTNELARREYPGASEISPALLARIIDIDKALLSQDAGEGEDDESRIGYENIDFADAPHMGHAPHPPEPSELHPERHEIDDGEHISEESHEDMLHDTEDVPYEGHSAANHPIGSALEHAVVAGAVGHVLHQAYETHVQHMPGAHPAGPHVEGAHAIDGHPAGPGHPVHLDGAMHNDVAHAAHHEEEEALEKVEVEAGLLEAAEAAEVLEQAAKNQDLIQEKFAEAAAETQKETAHIAQEFQEQQAKLAELTQDQTTEYSREILTKSAELSEQRAVAADEFSRDQMLEMQNLNTEEQIEGQRIFNEDIEETQTIAAENRELAAQRIDQTKEDQERMAQETEARESEPERAEPEGESPEPEGGRSEIEGEEAEAEEANAADARGVQAHNRDRNGRTVEYILDDAVLDHTGHALHGFHGGDHLFHAAMESGPGMGLHGGMIGSMRHEPGRYASLQNAAAVSGASPNVAAAGAGGQFRRAAMLDMQASNDWTPLGKTQFGPGRFHLMPGSLFNFVPVAAAWPGGVAPKKDNVAATIRNLVDQHAASPRDNATFRQPNFSDNFAGMMMHTPSANPAPAPNGEH